VSACLINGGRVSVGVHELAVSQRFIIIICALAGAIPWDNTVLTIHYAKVLQSGPRAHKAIIYRSDFAVPHNTNNIIM
jgi:hypothetical protein